MNGKLLNATTYEGKTYTMTDVNGFVDVGSVGFNDSFYGGRVRNFGKVKGSNILLCVEKDSVIDIFVPEEAPVKELDDMELKELKELAKSKGLEFQKNSTKEFMLNLLKENNGGEQE